MADKRLKMPTTCAQMIIRYLLDGQPCENVFYVQKQHQDTSISDIVPADFDAGAADVVGSRAGSWLTDHWAALAHALTVAVDIEIIWNTVASVGPLEGRVYPGSPLPVTGSNVGDPVPNHVTKAVEMKTALLGRGFHGRTYIVGLNEGQLDPTTPNVLKTASLGDVVTIYEALRTAMADSTELITYPRDYFPLGVMSFVSAGIERDPAVFTKATSFSLSDPYIDSQRRRLPGHNRHR